MRSLVSSAASDRKSKAGQNTKCLLNTAPLPTHLVNRTDELARATQMREDRGMSRLILQTQLHFHLWCPQASAQSSQETTERVNPGSSSLHSACKAGDKLPDAAHPMIYVYVPITSVGSAGD